MPHATQFISEDIAESLEAAENIQKAATYNGQIAMAPGTAATEENILAAVKKRLSPGAVTNVVCLSYQPIGKNDRGRDMYAVQMTCFYGPRVFDILAELDMAVA